MRRCQLASGPAAPGPLVTLLLCLALPGLSCLAVPDELYCANSEVCRERASQACSKDMGDEACLRAAERQFCDPVKRECDLLQPGSCVTDDQCPSPATARCDTTISKCVPCMPPQDGAPSMDCFHFTNPARPYCVNERQGSICAECMGNPDCPVSRPICDGNVCRPCREHKECGPEVVCDDPTDPSGNTGKPCRNSWVCMSALDAPELKDREGRCASNSPTTGRVIYVRQKTNNNCRDEGPGTPDQPLCTISKGVDLALSLPNRVRYVRLLGPILEAAAPVTWDNARLVIVGAETKFDPRTTVRDVKTLFDITGKNASIVLDQLTLMEDKPNTTAVGCKASDPGTSLTIRRSKVRGATTAANAMGFAPAIDSNGCDTVLLLNEIGAEQAGQPAHAAGVRFQGTEGRSYRVVGNLIAGNLGQALFLGASTGAELRFNTIVGNGRGAAAFGAVGCLAGTSARIGQSIVSDNTLTGMSQFDLNCSLTFEQVVVGPAEMGAAGADRSAPNLDPKAFRLTPQSTACIDKVTPAPGYPNRDLDGTPRPEGAALDIGAFELVL